MSTFFKDLEAVMVDRQELRMSIKKIGNDLVLVVTPNFKEGTKNIEMTGSPDELDSNFISEIQKPLEVINSFQSSASEVADEMKEEIEEEKETETKKSVKSGKKKATPKKVAKKVSGKKEEPIAETKEETPAAEEKNEASSPDVKTLIEEGKKLFEERNYIEAREKFKAALDLDKENATALKEHANADKWVKAVERLTPKTEENGTTSQNS